MKNLLKNVIIILLISIPVYCNADQNTTVLLSENNEGNFTIDFLNENEITAFQFDIVLQKQGFKKTSIESCVTSLPKSHVGTCKIKGNTLRVIVFSTDNSILESGKIGEIKLKNYNQNLKIDKVEFVKQDASVIKGDVLIDRKFQILKEDRNK